MLKKIIKKLSSSIFNGNKIKRICVLISCGEKKCYLKVSKMGELAFNGK